MQFLESMASFCTCRAGLPSFPTVASIFYADGVNSFWVYSKHVYIIVQGIVHPADL